MDGPSSPPNTKAQDPKTNGRRPAAARQRLVRRSGTDSLPQRGYTSQPRVGPELGEGPTLGNAADELHYAESVAQDPAARV
jgi:hypothetical protein